jgi:hypothetical protein
MGEERESTPDEQVRRLFGEAEKQTAGAVEELVHSNAFSEILARMTGNVMGLTKIGFDVLDMTVRNLRLAGKPDIVRLGKQLARNEDKLERVLQEVEALGDHVRKLEQGTSSRASSRSSSTSSSRQAPRKRSSNGSRASNGRSGGGNRTTRAKSSE